jgi:hypothetical protein
LSEYRKRTAESNRGLRISLRYIRRQTWKRIFQAGGSKGAEEEFETLKLGVLCASAVSISFSLGCGLPPWEDTIPNGVEISSTFTYPSS